MFFHDPRPGSSEVQLAAPKRLQGVVGVFGASDAYNCGDGGCDAAVVGTCFGHGDVAAVGVFCAVEAIDEPQPR
eukprot:Skav235982  [mRNA]  locus=scaffold592:311635:311856:- [translate_table: standard]